MTSRIARFLFVSLVLAAAVGAAAFGAPARAGTQACVAGPHSGQITISETWCLADSPHQVSGNVTIASGATLTIEAGVVVRFAYHTYLEAYSGSGLVAQGTVGSPITFTGDTQEPGYWANVWINDGVYARLDHVDLGYAGSGWNKGLYIESSDAQVRNSRIHHGVGDGIYIAAASVGAVLDGVQVDNNTWNAVYEENINSSPSYHDMTLSGNGADAVVIWSGTLSRDVTLDASPAALNGAPVRTGGNLLVAANTTLTVVPGSLVQIGWHGIFEVDPDGTLLAEGTADEPITLTSAQPAPAPADWANVWLDAGSHARLDHVDIGYAGSGWNRGLYIASSDVQVRNSRVHHSVGDGVYVAAASAGAVLDGVQVDNNSACAVSQENINSAPVYHGMTLGGNGTDAVVIWSGTLSRDVTLDASPAALNGAPVRLESVVLVAANTTLTVVPGSLVQVGNGCRIEVDPDGTLLAEGTAEEPIAFTSKASTPAPGDWQNIWLDAGAHARLDHVDIGYAGSGWSKGLYIGGSDVEVRNSRIHHSVGDGVYVAAASVGAVLDGVQIDNNTGWGISQERLDSNPSYHNLTLTGNTGGALLIVNPDVQSRSATLDGSPAALNGAPVVFYNSNMTIYAGQVLTVTAGSELRLPYSAYVQVQAGGTLLAEGTQELPVTFTSQVQSPTPGDWQRIDILLGGSARLSYCDIEYAGRWSYSALRIGSSGVQVSHCLIHDNLAAGIEVVSDAFPLIHYNQILGNGFGVTNSNPVAYVDARKNYWGDPTGPYHPTNPGGLGNGVSDRVLFFPWAIDPAGTLVARAGVQVIGPSRTSPGQLADYYLAYYTYEPLSSVLVAFGVPETAVYQQSDPGGSYLTSARQVYWQLGDLPAGAEGVIKVQSEYLWGVPNGFPDGASAILYSPDLDMAPFGFDPTAYYDYEPIVPGASVVLTPAQIDAELAAYPEMNTLYQQALTDGYVLMGGSVETPGGQPYTLLILLNGDLYSMLSLRRDRSGSHAEAHLYAPGSYQASNVDGGTSFDFSSGGVSGFGTWTIPGQEARAPEAQISAYACFRNCTLKAAGMWVIKKLSNTVDMAIKTKDCVQALAGDGDAAAECFLALEKVAKTVPGCSEIVEVHRCIQDCAWDFNRSKHVCDPSHPIYSVEPAVSTWGNPASWFGGAKRQYVRWTCNPTTLMWQSPETLYCPKGFVAQTGASDEDGRPCVPADEDVAFAYGYKVPSAAMSITVRPAHDPNAKLGPSGQVLPTEMLSYTITFENEGDGIAYGVFIMDELPETLDDATLVLLDGGEYSAATRTLTWDIGELAPKGQPGSSGQVSFRVAPLPGLADGTLIQNQAVVYFPSVPETTPTNWVVNEVQSLVAYPQVVETVAEVPVAITLAGADVNGHPLTYQVTADPLYGELTGAPPNLTYTPFEQYQGHDIFSFLVDNGTSQSAPAQVEIRIGPSPNDTTPPEMTWHSPLSNAQVDLSASVPMTDELGLAYPPVVLVGFSEPLDPASVSGTTVQLKSASGQGVQATVAYLEGVNQVSLTPRQGLSNGWYTVSLAAGITDLMGNHLAAASWQFEVVGRGQTIYLPLVLRKYP